jgi:DNA-binding NtrC family response regulator
MQVSATPHLSLISFASKTFENNLFYSLQALSQQTRYISGEDWLARRPDSLNGPIILALGSNDFPRNHLLSHLQEQRITPALAVISEDSTCWDAEILSYCREFLSQPFQQEELLLRLARGCAGWIPSLTSSSRPEFLEEFAKLKLIGQSPVFLTILELIKKLAGCEAPVLLQGETGTGKEMVARAIHYLGLRQNSPFIPVNCGALPDCLLENELFGHERGAYTDAKEAQAGLIAQAHSGTLFLDEVDSLSPKAQVSLLRFLQNQLYQPLGSRDRKRADVRLIAATNADLPALIARGEFRQDLWFRLQVMTLFLPPLRDRPEDIEQLAHHFLWQYSRQYPQTAQAFHPSTLAWMKTYSWPGNVRELENFVHRLVLLSEGPFIDLSAEPAFAPVRQCVEEAGGFWPAEAKFHQAKAQAIARFEKHYLERLMAECHGNISLAARQSGKERRALGKLLKKHQIDKAFYRRFSCS